MGKHYLNNFLLFLLSLFISLEVAGYVSGIYKPDLYNSEHYTDQWLNKERYEKVSFLNNTLTGWQHSVSKEMIEKNCIGESITYTHDHLGVRTFPAYDEKKVDVILAGDSYIYGHEVADDETVAAHMFKQSSLMAANVAVRAYGPVQAFLRATEKRSHFPQAKVVILGIMYDDVWRMMQRWRHVTGSYIGLKPYMENERVQYMDKDAYNSYASFKQSLAKAVQLKPTYAFPYSVALINVVTGRAFYSDYIAPFLHKKNKNSYRHLFIDDYYGDNLLGLMNEYTQWAKKERLVPIVFFIPENRFDTTSANDWLVQYRHQLPDGLMVKNLDFSTIDPDQYNIKRDGTCHPSSYGAQQIAKQYISALHSLEMIR